MLFRSLLPNWIEKDEESSGWHYQQRQLKTLVSAKSRACLVMRLCRQNELCIKLIRDLMVAATGPDSNAPAEQVPASSDKHCTIESRVALSRDTSCWRRKCCSGSRVVSRCCCSALWRTVPGRSGPKAT